MKNNNSLNDRFLKAVQDKQIDAVREYVKYCSLSIKDLVDFCYF